MPRQARLDGPDTFHFRIGWVAGCAGHATVLRYFSRRRPAVEQYEAEVVALTTVAKAISSHATVPETAVRSGRWSQEVVRARRLIWRLAVKAMRQSGVTSPLDVRDLANAVYSGRMLVGESARPLR